METRRPGPSNEVPDTSRHRALSAASRIRILHLARQAESGLTAAELATAMGLHPSTVRAHLDRLAQSGLLTRYRRPDGSAGRPAWYYQAVPRNVSGDEGREQAERPYHDLAAALIRHMSQAEDDPHAAGVRAGRDWGRALATPLGRTAPIDGLVKVLDQLGFTPQVVSRPDAKSAVLHLNSCPYLELAEGSPDVVCGVHQGVIGGAMGALGASAADTELEPFAVPGACVIRVNARPAAPGTEGTAAGEPA